MSNRWRCDPQSDRAFALIELLVVILIVGILAAIAIPIFLSQKGKASDSGAETLANTAFTAAQAIGADHDGSYKAVSLAEVEAYEPAVQETNGRGEAYLSNAQGTAEEFSVTATATTGDAFTITRRASGEVVRSCASKTGTKGGCVSGSW